MWSHCHLTPAQVVLGLRLQQHHQNALAALGRSQVLRVLNRDTHLSETLHYSHPAPKAHPGNTQHNIHQETSAFQLSGLTRC